jgi:bacteriocin-like protein
MNQLKELSYKEMITIEGGDWLKDFGAWCKKQWCAIIENNGTVTDESSFDELYLDNVGSWGSMI